MRKKLIVIASYLISFSLTTFIYQNFIMDKLFSYLSLSGLYNPAAGDFIVSFTIITILSFYETYLIKMIITKKSNKLVLASFYIMYLVSLTYFLFFTGLGLQGIELNPLQFVDDFWAGNGRFEVILNIIYFIPLGFLLNKHLTTFIICILLVEISQYTFKLGFFDSGDIILNTIGFIIGMLIGGTKFRRIVFNFNNNDDYKTSLMDEQLS